MPIQEGSLSGSSKGANQPRPRREYPYVEGQVIAQFVSVNEAQAKVYDDRKLPWEQARKEAVLRFTFVVLRPDGDVSKGHGRPVTKQVRKPTYIGKAAPGKNTSNAYKVLCRLLNNGGKDLTDEQLRGLEELVNKLEVDQPQYYLLLDGNEETGWVEVEKIIKRVPEDEMLPRWVRQDRPADPRLATDDPSIRCTVTGEVIHGWERSDGVWVNNLEWAEMQETKLGNKAIYSFEDRPGELFAPPFSTRYYLLAKAQAGNEF